MSQVQKSTPHLPQEHFGLQTMRKSIISQEDCQNNPLNKQENELRREKSSGKRENEQEISNN